MRRNGHASGRRSATRHSNRPSTTLSSVAWNGCSGMQDASSAHGVLCHRGRRSLVAHIGWGCDCDARIVAANAASLPAWMQLLHPFATVIAKSKLLVLPVYPAAWPQAKKHPFIQTIARAYRDFESLFFIQKMEHRYRQTEQAMESSVNGMHRFADRIGLSNLCIVLWNAWALALCGARGIPTMVERCFRALVPAWLIGPVISSYASHLSQHGAAERENQRKGETRFRPMVRQVLGRVL